MAKKIKIKHYSTSLSRTHKRNQAVKKTVGLSILAVVLLGVGFFSAPYLLDAISPAWQNFIKRENTVKEPPANEILPTSPAESPIPSQPEAIQKTTIKYSEISADKLMRKEDIIASAMDLKNKGATNAVITLKDQNGNLYYQSSSEIGKRAVGTLLLDLKLIADTFKEQGINCTANVYTFMDKITPNLNRDTAVKYIDTDYYWLDTAKELGGKPWTNPASNAMHEYMYEITNEILSAGFKEIIYSAVHLPTGYSLDKRDFGAAPEQVFAQLKGFINTLQTKVSAHGARASFAVDINSISGKDYARYIEHPANLLMDNIIITLEKDDFEKNDILAITDKIKKENGVEMVMLWWKDIPSEDIINAMSGYFV